MTLEKLITSAAIISRSAVMPVSKAERSSAAVVTIVTIAATEDSKAIKYCIENLKVALHYLEIRDKMF